MKKNVLSMLDIEDETEEIIDLGITLKKEKTVENWIILKGKH